MDFSKSQAAFQLASQIIPGGVNSPVRAFKSVGMNPVYISHGKGAYIYDIDGNQYIDYVGSWGPLILGHAHPEVVEAIQQAASKGTSYGAPTESETVLADLICQMVPSIEMVRMVNSGTEATMSAIRLARAYTGKHKIIKFEGHYHGHADAFLIKAGSGGLTFGAPDSPGVTPGTASDTLLAQYNNIASVQRLIDEHPNQIAALILEPVAANMGLVLLQPDFLKQLRQLTIQHNILLVFDEVITGFRLAPGGAQEYFGVMPDLTTLGKIIGGGLPVGAYGGKKEIMAMVAPQGKVYQAGTLAGNPLAMQAGIAVLSHLKQNPSIYNNINNLAGVLEQGLKTNLKMAGVSGVVNRIGSLLTLFFTPQNQVLDFTDAMQSNTQQYAAYFKQALNCGIYLAPSQFECAFVSNAHTLADIESTIAANLKALQAL